MEDILSELASFPTPMPSDLLAKKKKMQVAFLMKERTQAGVSWAVMSNFSL